MEAVLERGVVVAKTPRVRAGKGGEGRFGPMTDFARYLRRKRLERGFSQEELGKRMSPADPVHPTYISQLENGRIHNFGFDSLQRMAAALGVSIYELIEEGGLRETYGAFLEESMSPETRQTMEILNKLPAEDQETIADLARSLLERRGRRPGGPPSSGSRE